MALSSPAARRYADALVEVVAKQGDDALARTRDELLGVAQQLDESFDLANVLLNPAFTPQNRL